MTPTPSRWLACLIILPALLCGCSGIQSEIQKSKIQAAGPTATISGTELRLESRLKRKMYPDGRMFDLEGELDVVSTSGSLPDNIGVYHMTMKPGWKGWPGYYVLNFSQVNGGGRFHNDAQNERHLSFTALTKREKDRVRILFTWNGLGGLMSEKPKHFASYDLSVTVTDPNGKNYILTNPGVPTD